MANPEPTLTLKDVTEILGVDPETTRRYFATGVIEAFKTRGARGRWRCTRPALDEYLNKSYDPQAGR